MIPTHDLLTAITTAINCLSFCLQFEIADCRCIIDLFGVIYLPPQRELPLRCPPGPRAAAVHPKFNGNGRVEPESVQFCGRQNWRQTKYNKLAVDCQRGMRVTRLRHHGLRLLMNLFLRFWSFGPLSSDLRYFFCIPTDVKRQRSRLAPTRAHTLAKQQVMMSLRPPLSNKGTRFISM